MVHCIKPNVELPEAVTKALREKKEAPNAVYCSFCGKHQDEVDVMLAGGMVNVCDKCVALHTRLVSEHRELMNANQSNGSGETRRSKGSAKKRGTKV